MAASPIALPRVSDAFPLRPVHVAVALALGTLAAVALQYPAAVPAPSSVPRPPFARAIAQPLLFERNDGQFPPGVAFAARAHGFVAALGGARIDLLLPAGPDATGAIAAHAASLVFVGAAPAPRIEGLHANSARVNVARGAAPSAWTHGAPTFAEVRVHGLYPGIDLALFGTLDGTLEYNLILADGADASRVRMRVEGAERLELGRDGSLLVHVRDGVLRHGRPHSFVATAGGTVPVPSRFRLVGPDTVAFDVDATPGFERLTIDPTLEYATLVGGSGNDQVLAVAADADGGFVVAGRSRSASLAGGGLRASSDAFVARYDRSGRLQYATFLGGSNDDGATAVAVDGTTVAVGGETCSPDFPVLAAAQPVYGGSCDGFVAWLDAATGTVQRSTYVGGTAGDRVNAVAMRGGATAVAGFTQSATTFPLANPAFGFGGGSHDAFVARYNAAGVATFIGGLANEEAYGVAIDASGNVLAAGATGSANFPRFQTALPPHNGDPLHTEGWAASFTSAGDLDYATLIGGSGTDSSVLALAPGAERAVWLAGFRSSWPSQLNVREAMVTRVDRPPGVGTAVDIGYQQALGGSGSSSAAAIAVDGDGLVHVAGSTSPGFSLVEPLQARGGGTDAFVASLDPRTGRLAFSSLLGGSGTDEATSIAVLAGGDLLVGGRTTSADFPLVAPQWGGLPGGDAGFLARIGRGSPGLDDTGDTITCTLAGSATPPCQLHPQDAQLGRDAAATLGALPRQGAGLAGFDFSRLTVGGQVLAEGAPAPPPGDNPSSWGCTRDNVTGLTWEVKTANGGLRDHAWRYAWYSTLPAGNGGVPGAPGTAGSCGPLARCATDAFVDALNAAKLCGHADWRLPTARELETIVVITAGAMAVRVDPAYFPNTDPAAYWTGTTLASAPAQARTQHFATGAAQSAPKAGAPLAVRAVRGPRR
jgi:hypothetical protein